MTATVACDISVTYLSCDISVTYLSCFHSSFARVDSVDTLTHNLPAALSVPKTFTSVACLTAVNLTSVCSEQMFY